MGRASKYLIVFFALLLWGCMPLKLSQLSSYYTPIPETVKELDIPKYDVKHQFNGYPFVYWHFSKQKERQLDLESAELSNDSLLFRLWITNPVGRNGQPHGLIEIKHDNFKWTGDLYFMRVDFNVSNLSETITEYEKFELSPKKNDWNFIIDSLYQLKVDLLPTDEAIPNYYENNSGYGNTSPTYSFEYATKKQYRFYQYNNMKQKSDKFWQAESVLKILELLDDEFNWNDLGHDYFKKN
jgi:hypothetical protein